MIAAGAATASSASVDSSTPRPVVVAVGRERCSVEIVERAARFAAALNASLEAVHVETDFAPPGELLNLNEALLRAQELGAHVSKIPAASIADGLGEYVGSAEASHLVLGHRGSRRAVFGPRESLIDQLFERGIQADLLLVHQPVLTMPTGGRTSRAWRGSPAEYVVALLAVLGTLLVASLLRSTTGLVSPAILFLFPVIAVAARSGIGPTLIAVAAAVAGHNLLFLKPDFQFDAFAAQSWIMAAVLLISGCYTSLLTSTLRTRVRLSDRSARQSASLARFAQRLTQMSDWESTGEAVCEEVSSLLDVNAVVFREIEGRLSKVAEYPPGAVIEAIDEVTMQWAWEQDENTDATASGVQAGNWQFYPLRTSLGVLALVGLSRPDGRRVNADQEVLLSTVLAQAALAHERLWLEEQLARR